MFSISCFERSACLRIKNIFGYAPTGRSTSGPSGLGQGQSALSISGIRTTNLVHPYFETMSQCAIVYAFEQCWMIKFCAYLDKKGNLHAK